MLALLSVTLEVTGHSQPSVVVMWTCLSGRGPGNEGAGRTLSGHHCLLNLSARDLPNPQAMASTCWPAEDKITFNGKPQRRVTMPGAGVFVFILFCCEPLTEHCLLVNLSVLCAVLRKQPQDSGQPPVRAHSRGLPGERRDGLSGRLFTTGPGPRVTF